MSEIKTLFKQSSHYLTGRIVIMAAGFISFPILTRIFSVADYGILGLISTTLFIALAISKFGFPSTVVRYYAEFRAKGELNKFYSTIFLSSIGIAVIIATIIILFIRLILTQYLEKNIVNVSSFIAVLVIIGCTNDALTSFLRAEQRTKLYNAVAIIGRYSALSLGIFCVFYIYKGLYGFYFGQIIAGIFISLILFLISRNKMKIRLSEFSTDFFKTMVKYGLPLIWVELGALILNYADRYLIQMYLGSTALGIYTAGYNLATYVNDIMIYSISYAMTPIYMNILVNKGEQETKKFFSKTFRYYLLVMLPMVFGFIAVGPDLLAVLASRKYTGASVVLPYIVIGQLIHSSAIILNSGLFIGKKTHIVGSVTFLACLANIGLNLILIPHNGIVGSAQATVISYLFFTALITYFAFREFSFGIDYQHIVLYLLGSVAMLVTLNLIDTGSSFSNLLIKIPLGAVLYSLLIMFFDKDVRYFLSNMRTKQGISNIRNSSS